MQTPPTLLDLSDILCKVGAHQRYAVAEPPIEDEDLRCVAPVEGVLDFTNTGSALVIRGTLTTSAATVCARCLAPMTVTVAVGIEEDYALIRHGGPRAARVPALVEETDTPEAGGVFEGTVMNLTALLRQVILLELPSSPLHSEDCLGLCLRCGHDLNTGPCSCATPCSAEDQLIAEI